MPDRSFGELVAAAREIGPAMAAEFERGDLDDLALADIAARWLGDVPTGVVLDPCEVIAHALGGGVAQQPATRFSNLAITVWTHHAFRIEVLVWLDATTAVHQHSFAGAFKVIAGSSIHTPYRFDSDDRVNAHLELGTVAAGRPEHLTVGAVRQIAPGRDGLAHGLFHLDQPSITMVVRTPGAAVHQPQLEYRAPHVAIDQPFFHGDDRVQMVARTIGVAGSLDAQALGGVWERAIGMLDVARVAYLVLGSQRTIDAGVAEMIGELLAARHGERGQRIAACMRTARRVDAIARHRSLLSDPGQRFLLACLMNAPDRAAVVDLVASSHPGHDPLDLIARWLVELSSGRADTGRMLAQFVAQSKVDALHMGRSLGVALPEGASSEQAAALFRGWLDGGDGQALRLDDVAAALDAIDELAVLRRDG